jgi:hypothetical protein
MKDYLLVLLLFSPLIVMIGVMAWTIWEISSYWEWKKKDDIKYINEYRATPGFIRK